MIRPWILLAVLPLLPSGPFPGGLFPWGLFPWGLGSGTSVSQRTDGQGALGEDPELRFGPELWERMQAVNPDRDPWSQEALAADLAEVLDWARERIEGRGLQRADSGAASVLGGEEFAALDLWSPDWESGRELRADDGILRVVRFRTARAPLRANEALASLGARLGEPDARDVHWKVVGTQRQGAEGQGARFSLRLLYHAHGARRDPEGRRRLIEQAAEVTLEGDWDSEGQPRPRSFAFGALTEVEGPRQGGPLLVDVTQSAFAGDPDFERQFAPGMDHWRGHLAQGLGLPLLGHAAGLAAGDVNGDLLDDFYVSQPGGLPNRLFLAQGDGTFRAGDAGEATLLDVSRSALLIELDGDGDLDLVANVLDEILFFSNDGTGRFRFEAKAPGGGTTSMAAADIDQDGDLDLFAASYASPYDNGVIPTPYHDAQNGAPNRLYLNLGNWTFRDIAGEVGFDAEPPRFSFAASWEDFDGDGDADLYVANDFGRNELWRNDLLEEQLAENVVVRRRRFHNVAAELGVEDISAGMGVAWGDLDGDGAPDLYVSNMFSAAGNRIAYQRHFQAAADARTREQYQRHARGNSLFLNRVASGQGFLDVSEEAGVTMGRWAWGSIPVDLDLDGRLDLAVPNGFLTHAKSDDL